MVSMIEFRVLFDFSRPRIVSFNFRSVGGAIFMALEGPEEREICEQMREEIKERLEGQFFLMQVFLKRLSVCSHNL